MHALTTKQIIVLVACAVGMVFLVTFLFMYLGVERKSDRGGGPVQELLRISNKATWGPEWPGEPAERVRDYEWTQQGHYHFWFQGFRDQPVWVGLISKSCKCSTVELGLAPEETMSLNEEERADWIEKNHASVSWKALERDDREGINVPGRSGGWIRLSWDGKTATDNGEKLGAELQSARIWLKGDKEAIEVSLDVPVRFVAPVQALLLGADSKPVDPERDAFERAMAPGKGDQLEYRFLLWSSTRDQFTVQPSPAGNKDYVTCSQPVPLTEEQRKELVTQLARRVVGAYYVTVTARSYLDDDNQLDLGPFKLSTSMSLPDVPEQKRLALNVQGRVDGWITVRSRASYGRVEGRIDLGSFSRRRNKIHEDTTISADSDTICLELDKERMSKYDFLDVKLEPPRMDAGKKLWTLTVTVLAEKVSGPLADRDAAVYLNIFQDADCEKSPRPEGKKPLRRIKIPVLGQANY
jgi:hypothetical protein